jgi:hypothetical protein
MKREWPIYGPHFRIHENGFRTNNEYKGTTRVKYICNQPLGLRLNANFFFY